MTTNELEMDEDAFDEALEAYWGANGGTYGGVRAAIITYNRLVEANRAKALIEAAGFRVSKIEAEAPRRVGGCVMDEDDDDYFDYDEDDDWCDCDDYDADILEGRAQCYRCGRRWWLTNEQITNEIRWQASMMEAVEETEKEA